jgi:enoyl-CoA hydratase/carnithine racemase
MRRYGITMRLSHLLLERVSTIALITLNRPERRNALSLDLMRELTALLDELAADATVRAVILAASGKVFSSGHDLNELVDRPRWEYEALFAACTTLMTRLQSIPQPVIAEVRGVATAAGCQLVATCDLALADETASFATPGVRIGLFCSTPMVALTRAIGRKRAMDMLLTGRAVDAKTAADWGLINEVKHSPEALREATLGLAEQIATASAMTVAIGKRAFYAQIDLAQGPAYEACGEVMSGNAGAADAQEGIAAFLGKRAPAWPGR